MKLALAPSLCLMLLILIAGGASGKNILDEALAGRRDGRELKGAGPPKVSKRKCTTLRIKQPMNELLGNRSPPINLAPGFYAWAISRCVLGWIGCSNTCIVAVRTLRLTALLLHCNLSPRHRAPFYDDITGKKLGEYSETTFKFNSTIPSNCIVDAAFDFLPSTDGFFLSSLNSQ